MEITYVTGHQSSCVPTNQDNWFMWKMAVNLYGKRKKTVRLRAQMDGEQAQKDGRANELKWGHSHLQHFASHCSNHMLKTLQNSYPTAIVQQMSGYRDDLEEKSQQS